MKRIALAAAAFFLLFGTAYAESPANELPQCRGISITGKMREEVRESKTDPAKPYAKKHRKAPPKVACQSAMWQQMHPGGGRAAGPMGAGKRAPEGSFPVTAYAGPPVDHRPVAAVRTPPLRKIHPLPPPRRGEGNDDGHPEPPRPTPPTEVGGPDGPIQTSFGPELSAPTAGSVAFDGVGVGLGGFSPSSNPPDVNGRVGATQYVQWNNTSFAIFDKATGALQYGPAAGNTLFQSLGAPCATHNDGDPVVSYDILAGRWVLSQFVVEASPNFSHQCFAVSVSDDALGSYYVYDFVTDPVNFVDYPHTGVWPDGYYMTTHVFSNSTGAQVAGRVHVFERDKMILGLPARQVQKDLGKDGSAFQYGFVPADLDSLTPPPAGEASFILGPNGQFTNRTDWTRVAVTWGTTPTISFPGSGTITTVGLGNAPCMSGAVAPDFRDCVPQPSPAVATDDLDNISFHYMYRLAYRNFGGSPVQESLVVSGTTAGNASVLAHGAVKWMEFRNAGLSTTAPTVFQSGTFDPDTSYRWLPSIAMDKDHNIALGYSKSSLSVKPGIYMTGRLGTDTLNTMGAETTVQAGGGVQTAGAGNRWGDYSAMTLDPIDQCTFWYTNEYLKTNGAFNWSTRIATYKFPSCTSSAAWGTISGTITSCATGAPLSGVVVSLSNGFAGVTNASGVYTILVPAGTYTATAADTDRSCATASPATVSVISTSGATTTQNFCMTGTPNMQFTSKTFDDSVAGNNNGVVNRNECVNLNVDVKNFGCANATGVTATLTTSTTGVTVTQANSAYSDMVIDASSSNATPFKFQTSSSFVCGTAISFTLNFTYAAGSDSVSFTVPTCGSDGPNQFIPLSSLTAADSTQNDRLGRDGVPSTCSGKAGSGGFTGTKYYKTFTFSNPSGSATCYTVNINAALGGAGDIESAAYSPTYNPAAITTNLLGDSGIVGLGTTVGSVTYSFTVPALSNFVIVVVTTGTTTSSQFSGTVSGFPNNTAGPGACPACTPPATPTASNTGPYCPGNTISLSTPTVAGATYAWTGPNGFTSALQNPTRTNATTADGGTYSVTITVAGCTSAAGTTNVVVNPTPATPTASNTGPYCVGGTISLSTPTVSGATYAWTGPNGFTSALQNPTRSSATTADAGTYSVTVTVNGCTSAAGSTSVTVNTIPATPTASNTGPYCTGGTISLSTPTVSGATYSWTGPNGFTSALQNPTRSSITTADAGTYSVTITVNGCTSAAGSTSVTVNQTPATPTASNTGPYCAGATISLSTPTVSGATYSWTGPNGFTSALQNPTRSSATTADAGTYSVTVTVNGCTSAAGTTSVVVNAIPATPTASNTGPYCVGGTISLSTPTVSGATYSWTGPNGFTSALQNPTRSGAAVADAGTYSVTVTVNGCTSAAGTTSVVVNPIPATPTASNTGPYCTGGTISLSTPTVSGATYSWTGPNGFTSALQNPTRSSITTADAGTYSVTITVNSCTSAAGTTSVVVNATPATPTAGNGGPYCVGGTISLSTPTVSGATYAWTGPNGFTSALQNPTRSGATVADSGTYSVTVTVNGCTSAAGTTSVVVNPIPSTPTASNGGPYCEGGTISLSTPTVSGATYAWTGPNGFTSALQNPTRSGATVADAGTYSVTVTVNGCTSAAGTTNVVVNATPATPTASNGGPYCEGATIALSTPTVSGATYSWTGPAGFTSSAQNPTRSSATTAFSGTYSVTITVNGCTSAAGTTNVVVNATPATPTASNGGPYCEGATIALSTPTVSGATYSWTGPNGFTSALQNPTRSSATTADAGTYSVTITVNGCTSAAGTTNVVVNATPATPTASNGGPYCEGATIQLSTPTVSGATYAWTGPNGFTSSAQNPTRSSITTADAGTYFVTITVNGCTSAAGSTSVTVNATPATPTASNGGPYCEGATISLSTPTVSGATYSWTGPNGFTSALQNPTRSNATSADAGTYFVTVTVNGCTSAAGSTSVAVNPIPATPTASNGGPYCEGATISLSTPTVSGATYSWTGPNGFTSALQNPTRSGATAADAGTYFVTITVNGCTSAAGTTNVVVNTVPATPTASNGGPYCEGATIQLSTPTVSGATYSWTGPNGFTSALQNPTRSSATTADAGTYFVTITVNGCTSAAGSTSVTVNATPATPTASNGGPYCEGATISLSTPTVSGATYSWTGPNGFTSALQNPTRSSATVADAGTYFVTITVNGCTSAAGSTSVAVNPIPATPTASNGGPYCEGATIALSTPTVSGATYSWTGPNGFTSALQNPTRSSATTADAGTYFVTITVNGCTSAAGSTSVTVNATPATPTASNGGPYCEGATISLSTPTVSGATYSWTGPNGFTSALQNPTRSSATTADAGTYFVTITVNGCTSAAGSTSVAVNPIPATPTASNGGPYCEGATISLATPTVSGATYAWTGPNGFTSALQNPTRSNATTADAGTYSVIITVNGCSSAAGTTNVVVNATPATPTATNGGPDCEGATIQLFTPTVSGATYAWTGPNGFTSSAQNPTRANATTADGGTYSVTITVNGCTSAAGTTNVVVNATPATPTASNGGPYCDGATIQLSTPTVSGATYAWTGPNGFTSALQNPTRANATSADAGTYSVTITVNGCTSAAGTTNVSVSATLSTPTASNGGPYCEGATIQLSTPTVSGATYSWTGPNGFTSALQNPTRSNATTADAGTYSVTYTVNSCTSAAGTTNVVVNTVPATPTASNGGPYCEGATIQLSTSTVSGATYSWTGPNGFTSALQNPTRSNATTADAGTYSVTVTVNGCTSAAGTTNVVVNATPATPTASNGGPYCEGATIQLSTPTVSGATYSWTGPNGFTSSLQNPTRVSATTGDAGTYSVAITVNGCTSAAGTTDVVVNATPATPTITPSGATTFCSGGSVTLTSSSVSGNQWFLNGNPIAGETNQTYVATASGNYTVVVTQSGCASAPSAPTTVTVNPTPATPTISPSGSPVFCFRDTVTLTSSSATGNQWYAEATLIPGATSQNLIVDQTLMNTYSVNGNLHFTVMVTESGCSSSSAPKLVTMLTPGTPVIVASGPTSFCAGGSVQLDVTVDTLPGQWYRDNVAIGGATSSSYVATTSGSYTFINLFYPSCPSDPSNAIVVTVTPVPATPTITPGGPTTFCAGGSVTLTSSSASGNQWYADGNPIAGETNQTYIATASGNYTVVVTAGGCASAPSAATTVTVNPIPPTPTITPGGPTTFCTGGSVTLTSSSASGNQWYLNGNPIGGATNQAYNATASGNYTVIVTTSGCSSAASAATTVTVNPIPATPTITPGGPTTFCAGGSVTLTSSSASGNQWYLNGNPIGGATNQAYNATASGNYTVIVTTSGCSSAASAATTVTVNPIPATPTITPGGPTTFCTGGSVTLTSSSASGNQWYLDGNPIGGATNQAYNATASGNYTVIVTTSGCSSAASAATTVTVNPIPATPTITPGGPTTFCAGGSVTLNSSSASGNQWYLNGNPIGGATSQAYNATASGNYTVIVTTSGCSSAASAATTVTVNPIPATPTITPGGPTTFCAGGSVTLTSSSASGNQWYLNGNPIGGATSQAYNATASGNYTVIVTTSGCSSAASAATTVTVNPIPATPTITPGGPTTFCAGGSVTLTSSSASGNQWYLNGNPIGGATNQAYIANASGNYTVIVTTSGCSSAASAATTVTVNPIPATPTITPSGPTTFCTGGSVTLTSSSASGNQWYLNGNPIGGATNQAYIANASGNYTVIVTTSGCSSAASAATTVTVNPIPATPTITPSGPTTFCTGGSVTLTSSSASGNQWYLNGNPIGGATGQSYIANASGSYTVRVTTSGCTSAASAATTVTVNPIPATPTISAGGPTTFCAGGSVTLNSSSASGNQWYLNGNPIGGATSQAYSATASGNYTVIVTTSGCSSAASAATTVTVNPIPATPTITNNTSLTFCAGGSVTLTSSSASGNQWRLNGSPIGGATNQTYIASVAGDYTVVVTTSGCSSAASAIKTVVVNPNPNATIIVPGSVVAGSTGNNASVANAGVGATYAWSISGGTITAGSGTNAITFTAGAAGTLTLNVTVTTSAGCSDAKSANVTVTTAPASITVTSVTPSHGTPHGNTPITISGTGFQSGATVTLGGNAATNVIVVNSTTITAKTPAHAAGVVNVTVTNPDTTSATLNGGFTYAQRFDPNGDNVIDPADIFYLVNYLFTGGAAPIGTDGMLSGDANGDDVVDPADIFYAVNYLFTSGPEPDSMAPATNAVSLPIAGRLTFGEPVLRDGRTFIPVIYTAAANSAAPQAISISIRNVGPAFIHRPEGAEMRFEISRRSGSALSYVAVFDERTPLVLDARGSAVIAELELTSRRGVSDIALDPALTILGNRAGTQKASTANGRLEIQ